jgi:cytoskeletal protein CcmA (bactofilin family)
MSAPKTISSLSDEGTTIGPDIQVSGRVEGEEDLRIEGRIDGAISLTETVFVEASGVVVAQVEARDVVVSGIVIGDVTATNSVTLNSGAKLVGNIAAPRLIIADGAAFRGEVTMGDAPPLERRSRATATRARSETVVEAAAPRRSAPAAARKAPPPRRAPARSATPPRPAARPASPPPAMDDDEITVVVKHSALRRGETAAKKAPKKKKKAKKKTAKKGRARVPARGKRRAGRRS